MRSGGFFNQRVSVGGGGDEESVCQGQISDAAMSSFHARKTHLSGLSRSVSSDVSSGANCGETMGWSSDPLRACSVTLIRN